MPQHRREFLRNSALISAALAALDGDPAPARALEELPAPRELLRVAVVGVNGRGLDHLSGFAGRNGCRVVAVCDCDESEKVVGTALKRVRERQGAEARYEKDYRRLLDDKSIDIISVATPNHWHALMAIQAMQAGKDVYLEKPVSHNVREGRVVVQAARKYGRICQAGTQSRSGPGMREAIAFIRAGKIGKVALAHGVCFKPRPSIGKSAGAVAVPATVDYDLWCGPAAKLPLRRARLHYDWHWIWEYGNGDLGNQGVHEMDKARWGLGVTLPTAVRSLGGRFGYSDDGETANTQLSVYDFGESQIVFEVRGLPTKTPYPAGVPASGKETHFTGNIWYGSEGVVVCPNYTGGVALDNGGKLLRKFVGGEGDHYGNFVRAVRSRRTEELTCDILEGHYSSALCHLGNIAYRLGSPGVLGAAEGFGGQKEVFARFLEHLKANKVEESVGLVGPSLAFDAQAEVFTGELSERANALLSRAGRKGFEVPEKV